jgi:hypothetical protein
VTERRGRRRRILLDDLKGRRGYSHSDEEALDRTMWTARLEEALDLSSDRLLNDECEFCLQGSEVFSKGHVDINAGLQRNALRTTVDVVLLSLRTKRSNRCSFNYARTLLFAIVFHYEAN